MRRHLVYSAVCFFMCMAASGAFAQETNPCSKDISKFCSHLRPGSGVIADCLSQHEAELSPGCKKMHLSELSEVLSKVQQVCAADSSKFCGAELQQQGMPLLKCLRLNQSGLSPDCRTKLFEALDLMHY